MATLAQIANRVRNIAVVKAPQRVGPNGGNLKRQLAAYNRPSGMVKEVRKGNSITIELSLDVAPPGAEYGQWWNDPTVSKTVRKGKTKNIPEAINYGDKALNDPSVDKLINDYVETLMNQITDDTVKQLEKELKKI
jgi:hypothetical protein